ncbi:UNVERIFIED_CONTAM: hypothetical protein PYX00_003048 [Menopon gallinae]|uniref:CUB domain-containing protein n=1 Tax=Menopon gallinae TaxID=328185 RepID=A0AAW2HZX2_9NEOP
MYEDKDAPAESRPGTVGPFLARGRGWDGLFLFFCCSCLNRADLIKVHDGRNSHSPAIRVLCNELSEVEVLSTGPELYIEFVANSEWPGQGFKANFQFQPLDSLDGASPGECLPGY